MRPFGHSNSGPARESHRHVGYPAGHNKSTILQFIQQGDAEGAQSYLDGMAAENRGSLNRGFFHSLIHMCAQAKSPQSALWVAIQMVRLETPPDITTFNTLIDVCAKVGDVNMTTKLWQLMEDLGIRPSNITYNMVLNTCAQAHDGFLAEQWMQHMLAAGDGIAPCVVSYGTVISAFAKTGNFEKAEEWFGHLSKRGLSADRVIFNSLINACAKAEKPKKAEHWMGIMESSGIAPDNKTYNSLIHASAKVGAEQDATWWLHRMVQEGLPPDLVTFSSVIHACAKGSNPKQAEFWIERMIAMGMRPNNICYNLVLHACASSGDHERACYWLQQMHHAGLKPNKITYNCMIDVYAKNCNTDECSMWLKKMLQAGFHPDDVTFATLARADASNAARAWAYAAIVHAYAAIENLERIFYWLKIMEQAKVSIAPAVHDAVSSVCRNKRGRMVHDILRKLSVLDTAVIGSVGAQDVSHQQRSSRSSWEATGGKKNAQKREVAGPGSFGKGKKQSSHPDSQKGRQPRSVHPEGDLTLSPARVDHGTAYASSSSDIAWRKSGHDHKLISVVEDCRIPIPHALMRSAASAADCSKDLGVGELPPQDYVVASESL
jgi:pentatricopeptide repeat protein